MTCAPLHCWQNWRYWLVFPFKGKHCSQDSVGKHSRLVLPRRWFTRETHYFKSCLFSSVFVLNPCFIHGYDTAQNLVRLADEQHAPSKLFLLLLSIVGNFGKHLATSFLVCKDRSKRNHWAVGYAYDLHDLAHFHSPIGQHRIVNCFISFRYRDVNLRSRIFSVNCTWTFKQNYVTHFLTL